MNIREFCVKTYQEYVRTTPMNEDLRRALKSHERVPVFINNMARELAQSKAKKETVEQAVRDMTKYFISQVEAQAKFRAMSDLAKMTLQADQAKKEKLNEHVDDLEKKGADYVLEKEGILDE